MKFYGPASVAAVLGFSYLMDMLKRRDSGNAVRNIYEGYGVPALKYLADAKSNIPTNSTLGMKLHGERALASEAAKFLLTATGDHRPPRGGVRPGLTPYVRGLMSLGRKFGGKRYRKPVYRRKRRSRRKLRYQRVKHYRKKVRSYKKKKLYKKKASFHRSLRSSFRFPRPRPPSYTFYTPQY